jgi:glutaminyl-peptide cyclotransferase
VRVLLAAVTALILFGPSLTGCTAAGPAPAPAGADGGPLGSAQQSGSGIDQPAPQQLRVRVLEVRPHDRTAFTQGLELAGGVLYEGTGLVGRSAVLATDPVSGAVRGRADLPEPLFGEGITAVGPRIWQLTWRNGVAIERDLATLAQLRQVHYSGEGWGLCYDGSRLVMSDGTDRLTFRDPGTFAASGEVRVRQAGRPVTRLNELECTDGAVWANVWQTDRILRIDPGSGAVTAVVDAAGLLAQHSAPAERAGADVLNGIAALPGGTEFLITGKLWPHTYRVQFTPT